MVASLWNTPQLFGDEGNPAGAPPETPGTASKSAGAPPPPSSAPTGADEQEHLHAAETRLVRPKNFYDEQRRDTGDPECNWEGGGCTTLWSIT